MIAHRKRFLSGIALAVAGATVGAALEGPKTRAVATLLLLAAAVLLGLAGYRLHHTRHERTFLRNALLVYAPYASVALLAVAALRVWLVLAPPGLIAVAELPPDRLAARLEADFARLNALRAETPARLDALRAAARDTDGLDTAWTDTLGLYRAYGEFVETYKGFYRIDYVAHPHLHTGAFALGLWACVQQQTIAQTVSRTLDAVPELRSRLDAYTTGFGTHNAASLIRAMGSEATLLRLHAGAAYLALVGKDVPVSWVPTLPAFRAELRAAQRDSGLDAFKAVTDPLRRLKELELQGVYP
jgi:hypothetical protein